MGSQHKVLFWGVLYCSDIAFLSFLPSVRPSFLPFFFILQRWEGGSIVPLVYVSIALGVQNFVQV